MKYLFILTIASVRGNTVTVQSHQITGVLDVESGQTRQEILGQLSEQATIEWRERYTGGDSLAASAALW